MAASAAASKVTEPSVSLTVRALASLSGSLTAFSMALTVSAGMLTVAIFLFSPLTSMVTSPVLTLSSMTFASWAVVGALTVAVVPLTLALTEMLPLSPETGTVIVVVEDELPPPLLTPDELLPPEEFFFHCA